MIIAQTLITEIAPWIFAGICASGMFMASRFNAKPSALHYAEQEVKRLTHECSEYERNARRDADRIASLETKTDVAKAMLPLLAAMATHETNAGKRADAMLAIMNTIAGKLGPDDALTSNDD